MHDAHIIKKLYFSKKSNEFLQYTQQENIYRKTNVSDFKDKSNLGTLWEYFKSNQKLNDIESDQYHLYTFSNWKRKKDFGKKEPNEIVWAKCLLEHKNKIPQWTVKCCHKSDPSFNKLVKRICLKKKKSTLKYWK